MKRSENLAAANMFWINARQAILDIDIRLSNCLLPDNLKLDVDGSSLQELAMSTRELRETSLALAVDPVATLISIGMKATDAKTCWELGLNELAKLETLEQERA